MSKVKTRSTDYADYTHLKSILRTVLGPRGVGTRDMGLLFFAILSPHAKKEASNQDDNGSGPNEL